MKVVIDTSSLLSLVRYYLPFDKNKFLLRFFQNKIESGEIIILDKVFEECQYTSRGIVVDTLTFIKDKKNQIKTLELLPTQKFFNQLENQFINGSTRNLLTPVQFEDRKNSFLNSADAKLLLYCLKDRTQSKELKITIVSEETEVSNDNKAFKKLPAICKILEIEIITLPELLRLYDDIDFEFK